MIRYAVVGAGWISQEAFMPAVAATRNSRMQSIVSGRPEAARKLADFHGVLEVVAYSGYDELIASDRIDAVYIALPNSMHADYTIRALKAGSVPSAEAGRARVTRAVVRVRRFMGGPLCQVFLRVSSHDPATISTLIIRRSEEMA